MTKEDITAAGRCDGAPGTQSTELVSAAEAREGRRAIGMTMSKSIKLVFRGTV